ncbi:MAG: (2Fe-2S) ferredoxin domain-containing protein [Treponema sp.]|nr:(2Fe-2S) ferredoxin domain-containing protein [Candidatus Treponema caballi]
MVFIEVCVGSSCHLKGSPRVVEMLQEKIEKDGLEDEIILTGAFCSGRCNRIGVTITVNEEVYTGITPEGFAEFWDKTVLAAINNDQEKGYVGMSDTEKV